MPEGPAVRPRPGGSRPMSTARQALADARLYLCTDARKRQGDLPQFLDAVLASGVDIVQLRDKGMEAGEELRHLEVFADACRRHGKLLAVNDRADVAHAAGSDVLHLGQGDLPVPAARAVLGPDVLIGRSTHAEAEVDAALTEPGVDYFCTGPCWPTPTKPGRHAPGPTWSATPPPAPRAPLVRDRRDRRRESGRGADRRRPPGRSGPRDHRGGRPGSGGRSPGQAHPDLGRLGLLGRPGSLRAGGGRRSRGGFLSSRRPENVQPVDMNPTNQALRRRRLVCAPPLVNLPVWP